MRRTPLVGGLALVAGCSILTDLSGYSQTVVLVEGGPTDSGDRTLDAATSSDAPRTTDGATSAFCASQTTKHAFCADFDGADPLNVWSQNRDPLGQLELSTTRALSSPRSLFASLPKRGAGAAKIASLLEKRFDGWRNVVLELDIFLERPDWQPADINAALVSVEMFSSTKNSGVFLAFGEAYTNLNNDFGQPTPTDQWFHVKIAIDLARTITAKVGANTHSLAFDAGSPGSNAEMVVRLGVNGYNVPAPRFAVYYDNVTVDFP